MPASTTIRRLADRARYDRETLDAILDDAYVAHVGVVVDGAPVVLPFACARAGDELVLHGSTRAGTLSLIADGTPVCATVTHIDGLVLARSGGPKDAPEDLAATEIWGGVIPLQTTFGEPIPDAATAPGVTPPSVTR